MCGSVVCGFVISGSVVCGVSRFRKHDEKTTMRASARHKIIFLFITVIFRFLGSFCKDGRAGKRGLFIIK
jgi:hypothetical protein